MAITTVAELKIRATELVPPGDPITELAIRTIHRELVEGGASLSLEDISYGLRDAYVNPFLSVKFLNDQLIKYNLTYEN